MKKEKTNRKNEVGENERNGERKQDDKMGIKVIDDSKNDAKVESKGEREKTQDVEKFKGALDDKKTGKVEDSDLID